MFGHYTVHDFYEVSSTRGVYISTVYEGNDGERDWCNDLLKHVDVSNLSISDQHLVTMITYDNGGVWQRIPAPGTSSCNHGVVCSLHLYLKSSRLISHYYNVSVASGPLSIKSAPDIIVAHGMPLYKCI